MGDDEGYSIDPTTDTIGVLNLSLLVCSSINLSVILIYWAYLLHHSINRSTYLPPLFPHLLLVGLFLGSFSSLAHIILDSTFLSYTVIYSTLLVRLVYLLSLHKDKYILPPL